VEENKQNSLVVKPEDLLGNIDAMDCELCSEFDSKFKIRINSDCNIHKLSYTQLKIIKIR
jgi:hypothetical protein